MFSLNPGLRGTALAAIATLLVHSAVAGPDVSAPGRDTTALTATATELPVPERDATTPSGPALVLSYHATPAHRAALQRALDGPVARQLAQWRQHGLVRDYQLLVNRYVDAGNPDAVLVLDFADASAEQRWRDVTRDAAASGLPAEALASVDEIHTASVERVRGRRDGATPTHGAWLVIPYRTLVSQAEYLKYADGYVIPQFQGWMQAGVLARYELLVHRYPAGRPWNAMILLEYRDDASLSRREEVVESVRDRLKADPAWKAISDGKKNVRTEEQVVVADAVSTEGVR